MDVPWHNLGVPTELHLFCLLARHAPKEAADQGAAASEGSQAALECVVDAFLESDRLDRELTASWLHGFVALLRKTYSTPAVHTATGTAGPTSQGTPSEDDTNQEGSSSREGPGPAAAAADIFSMLEQADLAVDTLLQLIPKPLSAGDPPGPLR